jgi:hypothetical protein
MKIQETHNFYDILALRQCVHCIRVEILCNLPVSKCPLLVYVSNLSPKSCFGTFYFFANNCFSQNQLFLVCTSQSATTKLTVLTVGSYYVFGKKTHFVGETLPKTWNLRISHFSNSLIINSFLCKHMGTKRYWVPGTKLFPASSAPAGAFFFWKNTPQDFWNTSFLDFVSFHRFWGPKGYIFKKSR